VGEQISGILQRAHDTAEEITAQSRSEADRRIEGARRDAIQVMADARRSVKDLDVETDRIWAERQRLLDDVREIVNQLTRLTDSAGERFPPAEEPTNEPVAGRPAVGRPDEIAGRVEPPTRQIPGPVGGPNP
jgi:cell division septum initiation protein DivIVA